MDDKFTTSSGEKTQVKMMHQMPNCLYFKGQDFASLALPYAGRNQSMFIFLPDHGVDIATFQTQFTSDNWASWMQSYHMYDINLSLPRFKINYSTELNNALQAMGMVDAFSEALADFSQMVAKPIWLSRVLQKTYMDTIEEGTEAAAATAVMMATRMAMMRQEPVVEFRVDRPFVIAIVDSKSTEILFLGTIVKP